MTANGFFDPSLSYAVAETLPRREQDVADALSAGHYRVWLPLGKFWRRQRNGRRQVETVAPLFPNYLFVFLHSQDLLRPHRLAPALRGFLMDMDGRPGKVAGRTLEHLHTAEEQGMFDETAEISRLPKGAKVQVIRGPLAGHIGKLKNGNARQRVEVLFDLLGTETSVRIALENVRAVG